MTPGRASNGRGSYLLDRIVTGIGRIQRASGTEKVTEWRAINSLITELAVAMRRGSIASPVARLALEGLHAGRLRGVDLLEAHRAGRLAAIVQPAGVVTQENLSPADRRAAEIIDAPWLEWVAGTPKVTTRANRLAALRKLQTVLPPGATWNDLPDAVLTLRQTTADRPVAFNRMHSNARAIARAKLSRGHRVYAELAAIDPLPEHTAERSGPSVERSILIREALPAGAGAMWWSMFITGMGPGEYDTEWSVAGFGVHIPGTKRDSRVRIVPHIGPLVRRTMGWRQYEAALRQLPQSLRVDPESPIQPYDARRGFAQMVEQTPGITTVRLKVYMGHALNVTEKYARAHDLEAVEHDTPRLRAVIEAAEEKIRIERKVGMRRA